MKTLGRWILFASLLTFFALPAVADECEGVFFPNDITVDGQALVLNGLGVREATAFSVNVYVAALYLPARTTDGSAVVSTDQTRRLSLRFVRDVDREDIVEAWSEGFQRNASDAGALQTRIDQLNGWMEDMEDGDRLTFTYVPGRGVEVKIGRSDKGVIEGADFAQALFSIWFGSHPPNSGLKSGLLGGECG